MDRAKLAADLATDLEALADARMSRETFVAKYEAQTEGPIVAIWPGLSHYLDDQDVRQRDHAYAGIQRAEMLKLIKRLRGSSSDADLAKIHFLGDSGGE